MLVRLFLGARAFVQGFHHGLMNARFERDLCRQREDLDDRAERDRLASRAVEPGPSSYSRAPGFCHSNGEERFPSSVAPMRPADAILLAPGMPLETCESCRFFSRTYGECRRYAPTHEDDGTGEHSNATAVWPEVNGDDWCGDHIPAFQPKFH